MIHLRKASKVYGEGSAQVTALAGIDLQIQAGEFVSIMGPSGSGKSTLLHLLSALDSPTSGEVSIDGQRIDTMNDEALTVFRRKKIGLVFQFFNLLPTLDAFDNVLLPVLLERKPTDADCARAQQLLEEVGLGARMHHRLHELSGGEMQRVAISRALMLRPALLLADEPTGNLDTATGRKVLQLLRETRDRHGTTIVMVTHDPNAAKVGDRVITLTDGRVLSDRASAASSASNAVAAP